MESYIARPLYRTETNNETIFDLPKTELETSILNSFYGDKKSYSASFDKHVFLTVDGLRYDYVDGVPAIRSNPYNNTRMQIFKYLMETSPDSTRFFYAKVDIPTYTTSKMYAHFSGFNNKHMIGKYEWDVQGQQSISDNVLR